MQIKTNSFNLKYLGKQLLYVVAFLFLLILSAKASFDIGGIVKLSLQTLAIGIGYFLLPRPTALVGMTGYILIGILDYDVFSSGTGLAYVIGPAIGFFIGFILAVFVPKITGQAWMNFFQYFLIVQGVILLCGLLGLLVVNQDSAQVLDAATDYGPGLIIKSVIGATLMYWLITKTSLKLQ